MSTRTAAVAILGLALSLLGPSVPRADTCVTCHAGIDNTHPNKRLACTTCHGGDARATRVEQAHAGMWPNPSDLRVVDRTCGAGGCHQTIAVRVKSSIMAHRSGTQSGTLFPNGLQPTKEQVKFSMAPVATEPGLPVANGRPLPAGAVARLDPLPTFQHSGDPFFDLLRKECTLPPVDAGQGAAR